MTITHTTRSTTHARVLLRTRLQCGAAFAALAMLAVSPTSAQDADNAASDEIVVRGVRSQILEATRLERDADTVISVITADDIGQFPDQNIAESLQRVPGISIVRDEGEGRFVSVRGLDSSFVQVTVSNAQIGSSDPDGDRSVALDVIPSDLLSQIEVGKSLLPSMDHDSLGAKIDLRPLSAFDRVEDFTGRLLGQGTYTELANEVRPKFAADVTYRRSFGAGELGLAAAFNYFERAIQVDRLQSDSGNELDIRPVVDRVGAGVLAEFPAGTLIGVPAELDQRVEVGQRDRIGGTFVADYRIDDRHTWTASFLIGDLSDDDIRLQQEVELGDAGNLNSSGAGEVTLVAPRAGIFSDVDIDRQIFFQPREERTYAAHFEGSNQLSERLKIGYAVDYSRNRFTLTDGLRGRFRERDLIVTSTFGQSSADFQVLGFGDFDSNDDGLSSTPSFGDENFSFRPGLANFEYDELLIIDEARTDDIFSYNADFEYAATVFDREVTFSGGFKRRTREREFLRGEFSLDIGDFFDDNPAAAAQLPASLADIEVFQPTTELNVGGGLDDGFSVPELGALRDVLALTRDLSGVTASDVRSDFSAEEDTNAGYVMAQVDLADAFQIIAGFRVEATRYSATGTVTRVFALDDDDVSLDGVDPNLIQTFTNDYTEFFPAVHLRWEPSAETLVRFSYSKAQVRPSFGDANALLSITAELETPTGAADETLATVSIGGAPTVVSVLDVTLEGGNPFLRSLTADQLDATFGWYPTENTTLTAAAFYKRLQNTFIDASATTPEGIQSLGFDTIDAVTGLPLSRVDTVINGSDGRLFGIELAFNHFLTYAPGILSGLFVSGNLTLIDSETSSPLIRGGEAFRLPGQSNIVANVSAGFENEKFLFRVAGNHRGGSVLGVDADEPALDTFTDGFRTVDVSVRYNITERFQVFFDGINLVEAEEARFFRGTPAGLEVFERVEDFGRTFQFGVVANF